MKINRLYSEKAEDKKEDPKANEENTEELLKNGKAVGTAAAITGATGLGLSEFARQVGKKYKGNNEPMVKVAKWANSEAGRKGIGHLRGLGGALVLSGAGLTGLAAYKHHKYKKNKEKEEKNDSTKK